MLHKNLTDFHFGPKSTSRHPPQVELSLAVRGVFTLQPGQDLSPITDPMDQGFMSGDLWGDDDPELQGPITYSGDFADWKPRTDLLLKGTCYPPGGPATECPVSFGVGEWSKSLRVVGPRPWKTRLLFGAKSGQPEAFDRMALTWANAYGGPGYAKNPAGQGYKTELMPTVEDPKRTVQKKSDRPEPASFMALSPLWPQRAGKLGKKYGAKWRLERYPFFSEDFDWSYFNAAPADQQLDAPLRGDEELQFVNLHPSVPVWRSRLPGLRMRAFVLDDQEAFCEVPMVLDTLYADLDEGRLYLTWRGLSPVRQLDLSDVVGVLTVSEPLDSEPVSEAEYRAVLEAFVADPVEMETMLPPGFAEMGKQLEAEETAVVLDQAPPPPNFPPECSLTPLLMMRGADDPLGIKAQMPPAFMGPPSKDPLGILAALPPGAMEALAKLKAIPKGGDPAATLAALEEAVGLVAPDQQAALADAQAKLAEVKALPNAPPPAPPAPPPAPPDQQLAALQGEMKDAVGPNADPKVVEALAEAQAVPAPSQVAGQVMETIKIDDALGKLLQPLQLPDVAGQKAAMGSALKAQAALAAQGGGAGNPLMALFDMAQRLIASAPTPATLLAGFTLSPISEGLGRLHEACTEIGVPAGQLAGLTGILAGLAAVEASLPPQPAEPPHEDLAGQDFSGQDLSGQDFSGRNLKGANLEGANLSGAKLGRAILFGAQLQRANLTGADLVEADLRKADLTQATLQRAQLSRASLAQADLSWCDATEADLTQVSLAQALLPQADLSRARLPGANLLEADLTGAKLPGGDLRQANLQGAKLDQADLRGSALGGARLVEASLAETQLDQADLRQASLESAKGEAVGLRGANLAGADLRFAELPGSDLSQAVLTGCDLSNANLEQTRGDGIDLSGTRLDMCRLDKSRLRQANLQGAKGEFGSLAGSNLAGANLREVVFKMMDLGGAHLEEANFEGASLVQTSFRGADLSRATLTGADLTGAVLSEDAVLDGARLLCVSAAGAVFQGSDLSNADFSHADLRGGQFQEVRGNGANFYGATLREASFSRAKLGEVEFVSADLRSAELNNATLRQARFVKANCYDTKFLKAVMVDCDLLEANLSAAHFDEGIKA